MAKWTVKDMKTEKNNLADARLMHPVLVRILGGRNIISRDEVESFLNPDYSLHMHDPFIFSQMEKVMERIKTAKERKETVAIFGDYDADGITSTIILRETLEQLNLKCIIYIPDKKVEGYGLNIAAIEYFKEQGAELIFTVDCGITSIEQVSYAKKNGLETIVIDHHQVQEKLPEAFAIINPHMKDCGYPFAQLAGVGVTFKVVQAIYQRFMPEKSDQTKWLLDLVAIGTIADCVPLINENRVIAKYGLIVLSKTRRIGIRELCKVGRIDFESLEAQSDAQKVSFYIAPRINAAGRIDHANTAYELLSTTDEITSRDRALEIEGHNQQRQKITEQVTQEVRVVAQNLYKDKPLVFGIGEHFPAGIVGLVAGKITSEYNKPAVILQKGEKESKGSLRSIPLVNIVDVLTRCSDLLLKFGGHAQAAGITIANDKLDAFHDRLLKIVEKMVDGVDISPEIHIDTEVSSAEIDFELLAGLEKMRPFGEGNPEPVLLMKDLLVDEARIVGNGQKHYKLKLRAEDSPKIFDAICWKGVEKYGALAAGTVVDVIFTLQKDEWNGNRKIQMNVVDVKVKN